MTGPSVLYASTRSREAPQWDPGSAVFHDLNLHQVIASVIAGKRDYDLEPYFLQPLSDSDDIIYRQEVFADLANAEIHDALARFAQDQLVSKFTYRVRDLQSDDHGFNHFHRERFFLNAVEHYCATIVRLEAAMDSDKVRSRGLRALRDYLSAYVASIEFRSLRREVEMLETALDGVRYCVLVKGNRITVGPFDNENDYSEQVGHTFERFRQGAVDNYLPDFRDTDAFTGAGVLDLVAKVYPELFSALDAFCQAHIAYLDDTIRLLDREVQFYLSFLEYIRPLREGGLNLCVPTMTDTKQERILDTYDLALAAQLTAVGETIVCNDIALDGPERILVISGPNNGGKTTLARTFGQLHYLARLGCLVPGSEAQLFLCDRIYTHFEREEQIATLAGKLQDELNRLRHDFDEATPESVLVLNEVFNSTSAQDALLLSEQILERVSALDALCVCVTFLDELASLNEKVVSMVSTVDPEDPAIRTYKLLRRPADGRAYARAIADKYGLSFERLTAQLQS